jgi:hypothetical protein
MLADTRGEPVLLGEDDEPIPQAFIRYFRGKAAQLLTQPSLTPYLSSAEHTRTIDPSAAESRKAVRVLRRLFRAVTDDGRLEDANAAHAELSALRESVSKSTSGTVVQSECLPQLTALEHLIKDIPTTPDEEEVRALGRRGTQIIERIFDLLQEIRRHHDLGGTS